MLSLVYFINKSSFSFTYAPQSEVTQQYLFKYYTKISSYIFTYAEQKNISQCYKFKYFNKRDNWNFCYDRAKELYNEIKEYILQKKYSDIYKELHNEKEYTFQKVYSDTLNEQFDAVLFSEYMQVASEHNKNIFTKHAAEANIMANKLEFTKEHNYLENLKLNSILTKSHDDVISVKDYIYAKITDLLIREKDYLPLHLLRAYITNNNKLEEILANKKIAEINVYDKIFDLFRNKYSITLDEIFMLTGPTRFLDCIDDFIVEDIKKCIVKDKGFFIEESERYIDIIETLMLKRILFGFCIDSKFDLYKPDSAITIADLLLVYKPLYSLTSITTKQLKRYLCEIDVQTNDTLSKNDMEAILHLMFLIESKIGELISEASFSYSRNINYKILIDKITFIINKVKSELSQEYESAFSSNNIYEILSFLANVSLGLNEEESDLFSENSFVFNVDNAIEILNIVQYILPTKEIKDILSYKECRAIIKVLKELLFDYILCYIIKYRKEIIYDFAKYIIELIINKDIKIINNESLLEDITIYKFLISQNIKLTLNVVKYLIFTFIKTLVNEPKIYMHRHKSYNLKLTLFKGFFIVLSEILDRIIIKPSIEYSDPNVKLKITDKGLNETELTYLLSLVERALKISEKSRKLCVNTLEVYNEFLIDILLENQIVKFIETMTDILLIKIIVRPNMLRETTVIINTTRRVHVLYKSTIKFFTKIFKGFATIKDIALYAKLKGILIYNSEYALWEKIYSLFEDIFSYLVEVSSENDVYSEKASFVEFDNDKNTLTEIIKPPQNELSSNEDDKELYKNDTFVLDEDNKTLYVFDEYKYFDTTKKIDIFIEKIGEYWVDLVSDEIDITTFKMLAFIATDIVDSNFKDTVLEKSSSEISYSNIIKLGLLEGEIKIDEAVELFKDFNMLEYSEVISFIKQFNELKKYDKLISFMQQASEILIDNNEVAFRMWRRGWFLRSTSPTDLMILHNIDYPYEDIPVPVDAFYDSWDVYYWQHEQTDFISKHPIEFGSELGDELVEVSIEIIVDMVNIVLMLWIKFYHAFKVYHGGGAIWSMMIVIYNWLMLETSTLEMIEKGSYDDYMRVYRWLRWEAEATIIKAREDYTHSGNDWILIYIGELFEYLEKHHFDTVPLFKCLSLMDFMRDVFRDPQGDIDIVLDKLKGIRFVGENKE